MAATTDAAVAKPPLWEEFQAGVTATLRSWSALRTAVDSGWGGTNSQEKAEILRQSIYEHLNGTVYPPKMDQMDMEDALAIYMEEEFSITLEDNSEKQIADVILRMYHDCFSEKKDPSLCRKVVSLSEQASNVAQSYPVQVKSSEHDDDEDMECVEQSLEASQPGPLNAQMYATESLFGGPIIQKSEENSAQPIRQLGEAKVEKAGPEIDEDGFAVVSKKKKNKKQQP